jgi:hypothetical protein
MSIDDTAPAVQQKACYELGVVVHTYNPSSREAEIGGKPGLQTFIPYLKKTERKKGNEKKEKGWGKL